MLRHLGCWLKGAPVTNLIWFKDVGIADVPRVGGKNASLGEMIRALGAEGISVPDGFAVTAEAYRAFLSHNRIEGRIGQIFQRRSEQNLSLAEAGRQIRGLIRRGKLPAEMRDEICAAYGSLARQVATEEPAVAVRSSATAEDLAGASFAGQQETFLNVRGDAALLDACRNCFASLFTDRAISYRELKGFSHLEAALSVGVQLMVRSDLGGAGVMFTLDTESGFPHVVTISASWGLGESVVQGIVDPDQYMVFKPLLGNGARPLIEKRLGGKSEKIVYGRSRAERTRTVRTRPVERRAFVISDDEALQLARWAARIEAHYGKPMDIEWAKDGATGELFILQARPETVQAARSGTELQIYHLREKGDTLVSGAAIGTAVASGRARIIRGAADLKAFRDGEIIVAEATSPDWLPAMKRAAGVVTDHGGTTSHAAIVSRELGLPAVVGTGNATQVIGNGDEITLSCASGETGIVFAGKLDFERETIDLSALPPTRTQLMVNLASPDAAFNWWRLPARGVGLARMEFIIGSMIKAHPMALAHPERLRAMDAHRVARLASGYPTPADYFVDHLARGIGKLAAAFHPHPAIVRLSDFKTNEYADLIGGREFEPIEANPMIGFRGASRYYHDLYRDGFALECRALRRVREEMGFDNIVVMVPFCRTPVEADLVLETMAENGLERGRAALQVYMMCEVPSNVVLAEAFAERFDGFSIGSNDLTQLVLGVDRDSALLHALFNERDAAVEIMIAEVIAKARRAAVKIGICGQAPSDHPEFAAFLVERGIDSISLNPDSFVRTATHVAQAEGNLAQAGSRAA
jgi:pyruvate,water dikinase